MHLAMKSCCRSHCIFTGVFCIEGSFAACPKTDLSQLITHIPTHLWNLSPTGIGGGAARRVKVGDRQTPKEMSSVLKDSTSAAQWAATLLSAPKQSSNSHWQQWFYGIYCPWSH